LYNSASHLIINHLHTYVYILIHFLQACRNDLDLGCLAGPSKYHFLKDYWKYYGGTAVAPILTLFIGGNHEASNHLWELYAQSSSSFLLSLLFFLSSFFSFSFFCLFCLSPSRSLPSTYKISKGIMGDGWHQIFIILGALG
jgi:hypothetical protein